MNKRSKLSLVVVIAISLGILLLLRYLGIPMFLREQVGHWWSLPIWFGLLFCIGYIIRNTIPKHL